MPDGTSCEHENNWRQSPIVLLLPAEKVLLRVATGVVPA
jgi:hypothetical protein